ncbi:probable chitinase 2 [Topomyia yanbarensis]|uniref:probable chitinase 2 n=1 Tax=Topomyia yanbarensis TaxID=2498891 RepID=UPI00273CED28|nr:probable chitinase 2 [Topomyia yanbarensis]XP_058837612.1 probable chitinase 2 [Topomyia yanbarensis]XP_058837613.1 probable chitinase 2 [Topomyia yanbarensis]
MDLKCWIGLAILLAVSVNDNGQTVASTVIDHDRVVVCYISTWAVYRKGSASYSLDHFDPRLCTHAIYAFAGLDVDNNAMRSLDPWQDLKENYGKGGYEKLVGMRATNHHLKVLIAIGGWNEGSERYSELAANPERRQAFVKNALEFVKRYNFDGLDLDWEYPTQRGGKPYDRENFVALVKELSQQFKKSNLLLTSAIGAGKDTIDAAYDIKTLSKYLDFLHIMCYDYNGSWNRKIGPNAPLQSRDVLNVEYTIEHLMALGAPSSKIIMGLPFYGRTFVAPSKRAKIGDESDDKGFAGPSTNENGFMGYNEVCETLKDNPDSWSVSWDSTASEAVATMLDGNMTKVVIYDSTRSMANKVRFAIRQNLGGLMIWSVDTDDFNGVCEPEKDTFADFGDREKIKLNIPPPVPDKYKLLRTVNDAILVAIDELNQENEISDLPDDVEGSTHKVPTTGGAARSIFVSELSLLVAFVLIRLF